MKIVVKISTHAGGLGAVGVRDEYPVEFGWHHELDCGDNPAYYADSLQKAIEVAAQQAVANLDPFVVYRERP